jgi:RimJ/RimL family protein N-acetyltransferase
MILPTLRTEQLQLRPFHIDDAKKVQKLAGDWVVAKTTANIPHPYKDGLAEEWISTHSESFVITEHATFAIDLISDQILIGAISLNLHLKHEWAELGYWIGKPYWNQDYCTDAKYYILVDNQIIHLHFDRKNQLLQLDQRQP